MNKGNGSPQPKLYTNMVHDGRADEFIGYYNFSILMGWKWSSEL